MSPTATQPMPAPQVICPSVTIRQPDGSILIKAGRPIVVPAYISTHEAAKILPMAQRTIEYQCAIGQFKTACKPGGNPRSKWMIARWEVMDRLNPPID